MLKIKLFSDWSIRHKLTGLFMAMAGISSANARLKLQAQALNAAANTIVITDLNGDIVWSNPAFSASSGYSAAEVLGRNPRILQSGNHEKEFFSSLWRTDRKSTRLNSSHL